MRRTHHLHQRETKCQKPRESEFRFCLGSRPHAWRCEITKVSLSFCLCHWEYNNGDNTTALNWNIRNRRHLTRLDWGKWQLCTVQPVSKQGYCGDQNEIMVVNWKTLCQCKAHQKYCPALEQDCDNRQPCGTQPGGKSQEPRAFLICMNES